MNKLIKKYPKTSFMVINKLLWCVSFYYTIYIIQNEVPSLRQWLLGSIYVILTLPISYWLTYSFGTTKTIGKEIEDVDKEEHVHQYVLWEINSSGTLSDYKCIGCGKGFNSKQKL